MTLLIIFCLLILYNFIKGTFQLETVTKTSFIIIPIYALVMTVISIFTEQQEWHLLVTIVLILIGIMLGWFQTFSVRIVKTAKKDKRKTRRTGGTAYCAPRAPRCGCPGRRTESCPRSAASSQSTWLYETVRGRPSWMSAASSFSRIRTASRPPASWS